MAVEGGDNAAERSLSALPHIAEHQKEHRRWLEERGDALSLLMARGRDAEIVGNHIVNSSPLTEEEHAELVRLAPLAVPDLHSELEAKVAELRATLAGHDPLTFLAVASFSNVYGRWGEYHEPSSEGSEATVELIGGLLASQPRTARGPTPDGETLQRALDQAREIAEVAAHLTIVIGIAGESGLGAELDGLRVMLASRWMRVRGDSYRHHGRQLAVDLYRPVEQWMVKDFGFSIDEFFVVVDSIVELLGERLNRALQERASALRSAVEGRDVDAFRDVIAGLGETLRDALTFYRSDVTDGVASIPTEVVERVLDRLTISAGALDPSEYTGPYDHCPLADRPIFAVEDALQVPLAGFLLRDPHRLFERELGASRPKFSDRRARVLDQLASDLLVGALPGAAAHLNLFYWQEVDGQRVRYEADALILFEDVVLALEGKGGPLSVQAQRGDLVRACRDLRDSMEEAWYQSARVRDYITSRRGSTADFENEQGDVVLQLDASNISDVLLVNPTMHAFHVFALQVPALRELGLFDADNGEPWSVFINDLRVIAEMVRTPAELLHYIRWRSQLDIGTKVIATDELDIFGEYLFGLNDWDTDEIDYVRIVNATVDFDAYYSGVLNEGPPRDPPRKIRGEVLEAFLADLATARPRGWLRRSFAILDMPLEEAAWVDGWIAKRALRDLFGLQSTGFIAGETLVVALAAGVSWMDVALDPDYSTRDLQRLIVVRDIGGRFELVSAESLGR